MSSTSTASAVGCVRTGRWLLAVMTALLVARSVGALTITEIMYHAPGGNQDLEYIEIYNETREPLDLTGYRFTAGVVFTFRERLFLNGGEYLVICANEDAIRDTYGITNTIGNWNRATALDNGGETIEISNSQGVVQSRVEYNDRGKWPVGADGTGHSLAIIDPYTDPDDADNWALSGVIGGTPGAPNDTDVGAMPITINEALLVGDAEERWVELYNSSDTEVDLSAYHLTTNPEDLAMARLPLGLKIAARGYVTLNASELGIEFLPDDAGKVFVALVNPAANRVIDAFNFKPFRDGFSEARLPDGARSFDLTSIPTPAAQNTRSAVEDIVINEIFYRSIDWDEEKEFVEIYNRGAEPVDLTGWRFDTGIHFRIPDGTVLEPDGYLVVARNPQYIRDTYGLPADRVVGPEFEAAREAFGVLADGGEKVTLYDAAGRAVDSVEYVDGGDWSEWADGGGSSLELIDPFQDNGVGQAWDASDDSDRAEVRQYSYTGSFDNPGEQELHVLLNGPGITMVDNISMFTRVTNLQVNTAFFDFGGVWKYLKGTAEPDPSWLESDFDDSGWLEGPTPIGYSRSQDEGTILDDMQENYTTVYFRSEVMLGELNELETLVLEVDYDDGFILYINGVEAAVVNMDEEDGRRFDSTAGGSAPSAAHQVILNDLFGTVIRPGRNVLAVQVHNVSERSNDFRFDARLVDGRFVDEDGPNLLRDGDFEVDNGVGTPRWPIPENNRYWYYQGNHIRSGRTTTDPLDGTGSLKVVATGRGDNKVNKIETTNTGLTGLAARQTYVVSFLARWVIGAPSLLTHGAYNSPSAPPNYASSTQLALPTRFGTPGALNSVTSRQIERSGSANIGPVISDVEQTPVVPAADEPVTFRARVSDPDGVSSVSIRYTIDTPKPGGDAAVSTVPMTDPDGDGVYEGVVPPQPLRRIVVFWIEAADADQRPGRYPADHLVRTHPLVPDPANPRTEDYKYLVYRHDTPSDTRRFLSYRFWMHKGDEAYLSQRRLLSNDLVDGTFIFNDRLMHYGSKFRYTGSPFPRSHFSSVRIVLPRDDLQWGRIRRFNMENHQEGGGTNARERISHYLFRHLETVYELGWLVRLSVNDRMRDQFRDHLATPNRVYISEWFPGDEDGVFYEMDDRFNIDDSSSSSSTGRAANADGKMLYPPYGSPLFGDDKEYYRYFFGSRGGNPFDDFKPLTELARLMSPTATSDPAEFDAQIWDRVDVEQFLRIWAVRFNTGDWDTWGTNRGKNCYLYQAPIEGRWKLFPWDMELTYQSNHQNSFNPPPLAANSTPNYRPGSKFPEVIRMINRPDIARLYYGIMNDMIQPGAPFTREFLTPYAQRLQQAGMNLQNTLGYVNTKRNVLVNATRRVSSEFVDFQVTTNEGANVQTTTPLVTIEGDAPVDVRTVRVLLNGEEPPVDAEAHFSTDRVVGWTYSTTLPQGTTTLTFIAYDFQDREFATATIDVTVVTNPFVRGDANGSGRLDITDAIQTLQFIGGQRTDPMCLDALDSDDNGLIEITDAIVSLEYLFLRGPLLPPPFPGSGDDPTPDDLGCESGAES